MAKANLFAILRAGVSSAQAEDRSVHALEFHIAPAVVQLRRDAYARCLRALVGLQRFDFYVARDVIRQFSERSFTACLLQFLKQVVGE